MKNEQDNDLDNLFKQGLEDPGSISAYREEDWNALEQMLDHKPKRRGIAYLLPVLAAIAALVLLFLGWLALKPQVATHQDMPQQAVIPHKKANTGTSGGSTQQPANNSQSTQSAVKYAGASNTGVNGIKRKNTPAVGVRRDTTGSVKLALFTRQLERPVVPNTQLLAVQQPLKRPEKAASVVKSDTITGRQLAAVKKDTITGTQLAAVKTDTITGRKTASIKAKPKLKPQMAFRPQYAIGVLAASDLNGVNSLQQSKLGTNIGLMFSARVSRKLTVSTGAVYSVKPYITSFANYHTNYQFKTNPVNVTADCRMLDIPLNLGYQVYSRHQNKISVGTGLSSYIMLHENYTFSYANTYYPGGPASYNVANKGKYLLGVLNLNATYERQINSKVGFSVQPYVKLPLNNIGASQVRLQTAGVAVGLSWNLNSLSKP
ncbi:hypothetical protein BH09BAC6_BH09BAC6_04590 [soil metagenome]|jgi:hypothetical protein